MKTAAKGFTLLEIIIVLSLVTLVMGLSALFLAGFLPAAKLDAAARELAGTIRQARSLARTNMERQRVMIDLDAGTYGIEGRPARSFPPEAAIRIIDPLAGELRRGRHALVFHPTGGMAGGSIILSRPKKAIRIDLDPIVGTVTLRGVPDDFP